MDASENVKMGRIVQYAMKVKWKLLSDASTYKQGILNKWFRVRGFELGKRNARLSCSLLNSAIQSVCLVALSCGCGIHIQSIPLIVSSVIVPNRI